jgi:DNA-binding transcriptional LysR family regulator
VTAALHRYLSLYPQVETSLEESRTGPLMDSLRQGRIDVAFVRPPIADNDEIRFQLISTEPMDVVVPKGRRLDGLRTVSLEDPRDELIGLDSRGLGGSEVTVRHCKITLGG